MRTLNALVVCVCVLLLAGACRAQVLSTTGGDQSPVLVERFNSGKINIKLWRLVNNGDGVTARVRHGRLEVTFPPTAHGGTFGAPLLSTWQPKGDFDMQVDYWLLEWPEGNGVRAGLGAGICCVHRVNRGSLGSEPYDAVGADYGNGHSGSVACSDRRGKFRLVRVGPTISSYDYQDRHWRLLYSYDQGAQDLEWAALSTWSHDYAFAKKQVKIAFDNFQVNGGRIDLPGETKPVFADEFSGESINNRFWTLTSEGSGPEVKQRGGQLEVVLPSDSRDDPKLGLFRAGAIGRKMLKGNFDIQVDYRLHWWPYMNGARVGLVTSWGDIERTSRGNAADASGYGFEVYATNIGPPTSTPFWIAGANGISQSKDRTGTLRLVRIGDKMTGYYWGGDGWKELGSNTVTTTEVQFGVLAWSHDYAFHQRMVKVYFDNFRVSSGTLVAPAAIPSKSVALRGGS